MVVATFPINQMQNNCQLLIYNIHDFVCILYITHSILLVRKKKNKKKKNLTGQIHLKKRKIETF